MKQIQFCILLFGLFYCCILTNSLKNTSTKKNTHKSKIPLYATIQEFNSKAISILGAMCFSLFSFTNTDIVYETANDIPKAYYKEKKTINGYVVKISDGDTFRVRHLPKSNSNIDYQGNLKDHTIVIRIAAVDTPEIEKFGNPGQKYSIEAKEFVSKRLLNKKVSIKLLSKDQYGRVIGLVSYKDNSIFPSFLINSNKDISKELLKEGLAVVYRQGGAQYDGSIEEWNSLEQQAKKNKKNIWSKKEIDLPSDYKKNMKEKKTIKNRI